jgi:transcriptional regulator with XRE-family HTH domain
MHRVGKKMHRVGKKMHRVGKKMRLGKIRRRKGLTQAALAEKAGLSINTVKSLETRGVSPRLGTLRALARALHVPVADLL